MAGGEVSSCSMVGTVWRCGSYRENQEPNHRLLRYDDWSDACRRPHGGDLVSTVRDEAPEASRGPRILVKEPGNNHKCRRTCRTGCLTTQPVRPGGACLAGTGHRNAGCARRDAGTGGVRPIPARSEGNWPTESPVPKARCRLRSEMPARKPHGTGVRFPPPPPIEGPPGPSLRRFVDRFCHCRLIRWDHGRSSPV